jgi:putative Mn2+ efflux pump MntP
VEGHGEFIRGVRIYHAAYYSHLQNNRVQNKKRRGVNVGILEIILIAIGLSMDAFAVSITLGLSAKQRKFSNYLIPGIYFGFFQMLMPLIGYFAGTLFAHKVESFDHWIAFVLLGFIGGKMIKESFAKGGDKAGSETEHDNAESDESQYSLRFAKMLVLAIATSIDALAVGVTFSFFKLNILFAVLIIGITTFSISIIGVKIGLVFGERFKSKAEFAGGAVLVLLGIKILIEHLFF